MKQFIIDKNSNITYFFLIVLSLFPILPMAVESILMISAFLFSLLYFVLEGNKFWNKKKAIVLILFSTLFLIYTLSLLYTQNISNGIKYIIRLLPTVLFPVLFLFNDKDILDTKRFEVIIITYISALVAVLLFLHVSLFSQLYNREIHFWEFRQLIEGKIKVHGTYLSMWLGFGIILLVLNIKNLIIKKKKLLLILGVLIVIGYFMYWQYVIGSRMPFIATLVVCFFSIFKKKRQIFIFSFLTIFLGFSIILKTDRLGERFERLKNFTFTFPEGKYEDNYPNISPEQIRNGVYYCCFKKIEQKPLIGYGVGDVDAELQSCYDERFTNTDTYRVTSYNSHNQYFKIVLSCGIIGLMLFLISHLYLSKVAFNRKLGIYISFIFFVLLNFCFENILSRHDGVIFFGFFSSFLFFQTTSDT